MRPTAFKQAYRLGSPNHPHGQSLLHAHRKSQVLSAQGLVDNLFTRNGVLHTVPRIDDHIAKILIVLIA
jgi:hypothetical protein